MTARERIAGNVANYVDERTGVPRRDAHEATELLFP